MKKVVHSRAFRESHAEVEAHLHLPTETERLDRSVVDPRLQVTFSAWLESELDAAAIIYALSFRVYPKSDLARKARNYASRLRQYVTRIDALLPSHLQVGNGAFAVPHCRKPALTPRACEQATFVLAEFILHHANCTIKAPLSALRDSARFKICERLMERMFAERVQLAEWIKASGFHRHNRALTTQGESRLETDDGDRHPASVVGSAARQTNPQKHTSISPRRSTLRIDYHPPQIVRWM